MGESSSKTIVFSLPKGLTPNVIADAPCLTGSGTGCQIGTAVATSPGVPNAALANGIVRLSGSVSAPILSVSFPAPFGLTDTGQVNLANGTVTFADVPDLPLTSLALNVTGPNGQKAFNTDCAPASIGGTVHRAERRQRGDGDGADHVHGLPGEADGHGLDQRPGKRVIRS